jgi:uncharacterized protein
VFGWPFTDFGPGYAAFNDGRLDGGLALEGKPRTPPLVILYSINFEEGLQKVVASCGVIVKPFFPPWAGGGSTLPIMGFFVYSAPLP